jgi:phosphoenolpyruvate synthase/pyruvate phosphate dikinase
MSSGAKGFCVLSTPVSHRCSPTGPSAIDVRYADGFALECTALLRARRELGLTNIKVMIPFCLRLSGIRRVARRRADRFYFLES